MKPHEHSFRDRLLAVEPPPASVQDHYLQEIQLMFVKELSLTRRIVFGLVTLLSVIMACLFAFLLATEDQLSWSARAMFGLGFVFSLGWVVHLARILRKGTLDLKRDGRRTAQMVWGFTLAMTVLFVFTGMSTLGTGKELLGLMLIAQSLVFLIGASVYWLNFRIEESELSIKERLLQIEMQLAGRDRDEASLSLEGKTSTGGTRPFG